MRIIEQGKLVYLPNLRSGSRTIRNYIDPVVDIRGSGNAKADNWHHASKPKVERWMLSNGLFPDKYKFFTNVRNPLERVRTLFWNGVHKRHKNPETIWIKMAERAGGCFSKFIRDPDLLVHAPPLEQFLGLSNAEQLTAGIYVFPIENIKEKLPIFLENSGVAMSQLNEKALDKMVGKTVDLPNREDLISADDELWLRKIYKFDFVEGNY